MHQHDKPFVGVLNESLHVDIWVLDDPKHPPVSQKKTVQLDGNGSIRDAAAETLDDASIAVSISRSLSSTQHGATSQESNSCLAAWQQLDRTRRGPVSPQNMLHEPAPLFSFHHARRSRSTAPTIHCAWNRYLNCRLRIRAVWRERIEAEARNGRSPHQALPNFSGRHVEALRILCTLYAQAYYSVYRSIKPRLCCPVLEPPRWPIQGPLDPRGPRESIACLSLRRGLPQWEGTSHKAERGGSRLHLGFWAKQTGPQAPRSFMPEAKNTALVVPFQALDGSRPAAVAGVSAGN